MASVPPKDHREAKWHKPVSTAEGFHHAPPTSPITLAGQQAARCLRADAILSPGNVARHRPPATSVPNVHLVQSVCKTVTGQRYQDASHLCGV